MSTYHCEACGKECTPVQREVGPSADCCLEARLTVLFCPSHPDKCAGCETRLLTRFEEQELAYELHAEADAERTPAERRRVRSAQEG